MKHDLKTVKYFKDFLSKYKSFAVVVDGTNWYPIAKVEQYIIDDSAACVFIHAETKQEGESQYKTAEDLLQVLDTYKDSAFVVYTMYKYEFPAYLTLDSINNTIIIYGHF